MYLAPQNIPRATVLTLGNQFVLYCIDSQRPSSHRKGRIKAKHDSFGHKNKPDALFTIHASVPWRVFEKKKRKLNAPGRQKLNSGIPDTRKNL